MKVRGFTLIELLVVVAIIGILSAIVITNNAVARQSARDTKRISEVNEIRTALELFYAANGRYPGLGDTPIIDASWYVFSPYAVTGVSNECGYTNDWCDLEIILRPYIKSLPKGSGSTVFGAGANGRRYTYRRLPSRPDLYGLAVALDSARPASINDGGYYPQAYEVGPVVSYCASKYSGAGAAWIFSVNLCVGGN